MTEYKHKALYLHPDKNPQDNTLLIKFQKLQVNLKNDKHTYWWWTQLMIFILGS